jgi:hypothetical protein
MMFAGVTTVAILVAFIADVLLSRRLPKRRAAAESAPSAQPHRGRRAGLVRHPRRASDLKSAGYDVAVIERDDDNRFLSTAASARHAGDLRRRDAAPDVGSGARRPGSPGGRRADAGRHGQHRDRHRVARDVESEGDARRGTPRCADRAAGVRPHVERRRRTAIRVRICPLDRRSRDAVVHRRGHWAAGAGHVLGGQRLFMVGGVHVAPSASSMGCGCSTCPPRPALSRSPGPMLRCGCTRGATPGSPPATPPTWSALIGNCWTPCERGKVSSGPMSLIQRRQVESRARRRCSVTTAPVPALGTTGSRWRR